MREAVAKSSNGIVGTIAYVLAVSTRYMTPRERAKGAVLAVASFAVGVLEIVALASVMPVIGLIADPERTQASRLFAVARLTSGSRGDWTGSTRKMEEKRGQNLQP